jgi:hypothetical protein
VASEVIHDSMAVDVSHSNLHPLSSPRIDIIGIPTHNHPHVLARGLRSYIENNSAFSRSAEYVVLDDSTEPGVRESNLHLLRELRQKYQVDIAYAGTYEKATFSTHLKRMGIAPEIADFALLGIKESDCTTGANRNSLLLHAVDSLFLSADDDTICHVVPAPEIISGLRITSNEPTEMWFPDHMEPGLIENSYSILGLHEEWLGKNIRECVCDYVSSEIQIDSGSEVLLARVEQGSGSIQATWMGLAGDLGTPHLPSWLIRQTGDTRERLMQTESTYRRVMAERTAIRCAPCPTISDAHAWMTTITAYDNREILPPFLPVGRGQDTLFGSMLAKCAPDSFVAYLPYSVTHQPHGPRLDKLQIRHLRVHLFHVVLFCLEALTDSPEVLDRSVSIRTLGYRLRDLVSNMTLSEFGLFVRIHAQQRSIEQISYCEHLLQWFNYLPQYWADDLQGYIQLRRSVLESKDFGVPLELESARTSARAVQAAAKRIVLLYSRLLLAWPDIMNATREMNAQGVRLGLPVDSLE